MPTPWLLTSPASRGIGFALARHLLRTTTLPLVATARSDLSGVRTRLLADLDVDPARLTVLPLDVTDEPSIASAASTCRTLFPPPTSPLHLAFCVPGILLAPEKSPAQIDPAATMRSFAVNTLGPMLLFKHFWPFLPRKTTSTTLPSSADVATLPAAAVFAIMSARVGSISDNRAGGWYSYRASKAGVNMGVRGFDVWLRGTAGERACVVGLHPGTVRTGLSEGYWEGVRGRGELLEAEEVAGRLCGVVREKGVGGRGRCWDWRGEEVLP